MEVFTNNHYCFASSQMEFYLAIYAKISNASIPILFYYEKDDRNDNHKQYENNH